jgi:AcrR family transcriptional regulator
MPREHLDTASRKEQIIDAALALAGSGGLEAVSMAAVAERLGLVPSALYRHFSSKDELLDAMLDLIPGKLLGGVTAVRAETSDPMTQLQMLLMRHLRMIREHRGIPHVIFSQEFYAKHPERRARVYEGIRGYLAEIAAIIRSGKKAGQIREDVPPDAAAVFFLGLIQPSAVLRHMSEGRFDLIRQGRRAWPLFARAVCARVE